MESRRLYGPAYMDLIAHQLWSRSKMSDRRDQKYFFSINPKELALYTTPLHNIHTVSGIIADAGISMALWADRKKIMLKLNNKPFSKDLDRYLGRANNMQLDPERIYAPGRFGLVVYPRLVQIFKFTSARFFPSNMQRNNGITLFVALCHFLRMTPNTSNRKGIKSDKRWHSI